MFFRGRHTGRLVESGFRPDLTPRAYRVELETGRALCYAVMRTMSLVRSHSPVRYIPAPRIGWARVVIQTGRMVPAQHSWLPVWLCALCLRCVCTAQCILC